MSIRNNTLIGGLVAAALVGGFAVQPANAGNYFSLSLGSSDGCYTYVPPASYRSYSYSSYGSYCAPRYRQVVVREPRCSPPPPRYSSYGYSSRTYYEPRAPRVVHTRRHVRKVYKSCGSRNVHHGQRVYSSHKSKHRDHGRRVYSSHRSRHSDHGRRIHVGHSSRGSRHGTRSHWR